MKEKNKILLPDGFEETKLAYDLNNPELRDAKEILLKYCKSCADKSNCDTHGVMQYALKKNYSYWSNRFIAINVNLSYSPPGFAKKVFCTDYKDPKPKLPGISRNFSDGVERLIEIVKEEKKDRLEKLVS